MIFDWLTVLEGKKEAMWQLLRKIFILPRETKDKVKHYARKMLGENFHRCVTPDLQEHKPSNHICARIKSRIYTTELSRYHNNITK
jgi:hypothetical protein